jgi:hypothetical protein
MKLAATVNEAVADAWHSDLEHARRLPVAF